MVKVTKLAAFSSSQAASPTATGGSLSLASGRAGQRQLLPGVLGIGIGYLSCQAIDA